MLSVQNQEPRLGTGSTPNDSKNESFSRECGALGITEVMGCLLPCSKTDQPNLLLEIVP